MARVHDQVFKDWDQLIKQVKSGFLLLVLNENLEPFVEFGHPCQRKTTSGCFGSTKDHEKVCEEPVWRTLKCEDPIQTEGVFIDVL